MKDVIAALKKARNKCADTVDKSTLEELDAIIKTMQEKENENVDSMKLLKVATKILVIIKALGGFDG